MIQAGAYSSYDNMVKNTLLSNYAYFEDEDGLYKSIIGLTKNYDNIEKIKNTYQEKVYIKEYYSKDKELNNKIKEYDEKLNNIVDEKEIKNAITEMLKLYQNKNVTLIQIDS